MFSVERRGAPAFKRKHNSTKNLDFKNLRKPLGRPISKSTWLPDDSASAHHAHGVPIYLSFVSKAILWDRGLSHHTIHDRPNHHPLLCPRFLSHMKTGPEDIRPPCFLSSKSRPQPSFQGKMLNTHTPAAPKGQTLEGFLHPSPDRRKLVKNDGSIPGRRSAFVIPSLQLPSTQPSSTIYPTFPHLNTLHADSGGQQRKKNTIPSSPSELPPAPEEKVREKEPHLAVVSITESVSKLHLRPSGPERFPSPVSVVSHGSLSDFSRPPSTLFSRSTDLSSRISVLSVSSRDSDPDGEACFSPFQHYHLAESRLTSCPPAGCYSRRSSINTPNSPTLYEAASGQIKPLSPRPMSGVPPQADTSLSRPECSRASENLHQGATVDLHYNPSMDCHHGLITGTTPSATSYLNPQWTTPRSGSRPKLTPSASVTRQESHRWPVLPPIAPVRGCCSTPASRYSELSCSDSRVFDELEAIAPRSTSSPSVDKLSDSSGCPSPPTELSPGLAALTVGCDSGNLGSLSRVQLLLLDRLEPETLMSPFDQEDLDWSDLWKDYDHTGVSRPLTAGSISERCDSTGKVQKNTSNHSEGGSGSPSSWIMDQSPSYNMFRSATSPCNANHGSSTNEGGPTSEGASAGGRRSGNFDHSAEEKDRRMDERKSKALDMLTKLQEDKPHQANGSRGRSNFDDFAFLAKYCIFSPVKLSEYKRAFEAEDSDDDGYISCLQVLLALKTIIPSGLLSDEEEIYVYKILEMVDFRVTDGLVDLRLFAVISSLAQKIATMDEFMRSLISNMDFRSLEVRLFKVKQLFLFLLEEQQGDTGTQQGFISAEQLLLELKAGGIHLEQEAAVRLELQRMPPLDLLDFLAHLPLFMLIHKSVIANPLDDSSNL